MDASVSGRPDAGADPQARIALSVAPALLWTCGADRRRLWLSPAWTEHTGLPVEKLLGDGWLDAVHPDDVGRCTGIIDASIEARQPYTLDFRLRERDGRYRWFLDSGAPHAGGAGIDPGYAGAAVDIDVRKSSEDRLAERARALRLAERRQAAFLATLSHALRNPLAPISNAANVLRTLEDGQPSLGRLREILDRQVGRLGRLVDELVDATRAAQGQISLVREEVRVAAMVHAAVEAAGEALNARGHTLEVDMPDPGLVVPGDPARLAQALTELVGNAAKFTPEPGTIRLEVRRLDRGVEIAVTDPGQGISAAFLPHVFELFSQQDPGTGGRPGGLGLGLTLARRIAQLHGGDVSAHSAGPHRGARFALHLPLAGAPHPAAAPPPLADRYRVLVIDADPVAREDLVREMERWGNEVRGVNDLAEALRLIGTFPAQIVLCDLDSGASAGLQDLRVLRARLAPAHAVFAAVAGADRSEEAARALAGGYDSFLIKPLQPDMLPRLLRAAASAQS